MNDTFRRVPSQKHAPRHRLNAALGSVGRGRLVTLGGIVAVISLSVACSSTIDATGPDVVGPLPPTIGLLSLTESEFPVVAERQPSGFIPIQMNLLRVMFEGVLCRSLTFGEVYRFKLSREPHEDYSRFVETMLAMYVDSSAAETVYRRLTLPSDPFDSPGQHFQGQRVVERDFTVGDSVLLVRTQINNLTEISTSSDEYIAAGRVGNVVFTVSGDGTDLFTIREAVRDWSMKLQSFADGEPMASEIGASANEEIHRTMLQNVCPEG